ncbi:hydrolase or acyltransferase [Pseudomonas sp. S25]|uniref:Hydrolase or acyltransferase n=1 Tax=Pseudomonas maioricensis TaxID=1766623 RepID=A0ABS9ZFV1_9PSED|nr:alpha/beta hydrolase family protein [Pseudomonas sp. S25]MCI8208442.1 hydrolase or acyltransferase [Pseudomonas sp. S25]
MSYTFRATLPTLCLALILPCALPVLAADPAPAKDPATEPAVERAPLLPRTQEDALALEGRLPVADQQQLQAGEDSFLALWKPANTDDPKGAVIIIPGADESADSPDTVGPLRRKFPDIGWASLSLTMPDQLADYSQAREAEGPAEAGNAEKPKDAAPTDADKTAAAEKQAAAETARAAATEEQAKAQAERIIARIESGISFAQQNKARSIVLLGHGNGAYWAARYLSERPAPLVQKFAMVTAREPQDAKPLLTELIPGLKVKTSDFIYKDATQRAAVERLQVSKRTKGPGYSQIPLTAIPGNFAAEQEQMFRRVRGWVEAQ